VVNLGFGVSWKGWPRYLGVGLIALGAAAGWLVEGTWWTPELGRFVQLFILYTFGHLGLSFLLSAVIATPGCEMRALPHLPHRQVVFTIPKRLRIFFGHDRGGEQRLAVVTGRSHW